MTLSVASTRSQTAVVAKELGLLPFMQELAKHTGKFQSVTIYKRDQIVAHYSQRERQLERNCFN